MNKATIPVEALECQFLAAMSLKLQSEDLREELVQALLHHLGDAKNKRISEQEATDRTAAQLDATRATLKAQIDNLVRAIRECGGSRALLAELGEAEVALGRVEARLAETTKPPIPEITEGEVRRFLSETAESFGEILMGAPEALKNELQRRISSITLTPSTDDHGQVYTATGDVGLFSAPEDAVQTNQLHLIGLHYTIPISVDVVAYRNRLRRAA